MIWADKAAIVFAAFIPIVAAFFTGLGAARHGQLDLSSFEWIDLIGWVGNWEVLAALPLWLLLRALALALDDDKRI